MHIIYLYVMMKFRVEIVGKKDKRKNLYSNKELENRLEFLM